MKNMITKENINPNNWLKRYLKFFIIGISAGIICRLSDLFPYESLWSLSSVATLFGFWIASVTVITMHSNSHKDAFANTFLYLFGMTLSFYVLKYLLGFFVAEFDNAGVFQTNLFILYTGLSLLCGIGSSILYFWNDSRWYSSVLFALPVGALFAEGIACGIILVLRHMLLGQTLFDLACGVWLYSILGKKSPNKLVFTIAALAAAAMALCVVYRNWIIF